MDGVCKTRTFGYGMWRGTVNLLTIERQTFHQFIGSLEMRDRSIKTAPISIVEIEVEVKKSPRMRSHCTFCVFRFCFRRGVSSRNPVCQHYQWQLSTQFVNFSKQKVSRNGIGAICWYGDDAVHKTAVSWRHDVHRARSSTRSRGAVALYNSTNHKSTYNAKWKWEIKSTISFMRLIRLLLLLRRLLRPLLLFGIWALKINRTNVFFSFFFFFSCRFENGMARWKSWINGMLVVCNCSPPHIRRTILFANDIRFGVALKMAKIVVSYINSGTYTLEMSFFADAQCVHCAGTKHKTWIARTLNEHFDSIQCSAECSVWCFSSLSSSLPRPPSLRFIVTIECLKCRNDGSTTWCGRISAVSRLFCIGVAIYTCHKQCWPLVARVLNTM